LSLNRIGANLSKIADALGVSTATVSNALSGKGRVSAGMVEKVRVKAGELGYVASSAGRALRTGKSGVLGLVLPDISNPLFPQIAQAIEFAASKAGFGVLIGDSRGEIGMQTETIGRLLERGVDGMVVVPRRGTRIVDVGCPVAVIDTPSTPGNTVSADHWQAGQQIARHLYGIGHRRIVLVGNNAESNVQNDRIGGMRSVAGLNTETIWIQKLQERAGSDGTLGLVTKVRQGATAFATVSDLHALRVLMELQSAGLRVPKDVSVTGFDDLVWAPVMTPSLTTMRMDMARIAEIAVAALVEAIGSDSIRVIEGKRSTVEAPIQKVPMSLVVRNSSAPPFRGESKTPEGEHAA
jgi:LacI family transcriptional regulator